MGKISIFIYLVIPMNRVLTKSLTFIIQKLFVCRQAVDQVSLVSTLGSNPQAFQYIIIMNVFNSQLVWNLNRGEIHCNTEP